MFRIKEKLKKTRIYINIVQLGRIFHKVGANPIHFIWPTFLSLFAACFAGINVGLMIPVLKGIIHMDFGFVRETPFFKPIIDTFPQLFRTPNSSIFILLMVLIALATVLKLSLNLTSGLLMGYQLKKFSCI